MKESIEELAERLGTDAGILAGAKVRFGWVVGTTLTEADFKAGVQAFAASPTHAALEVKPVLEVEKPVLEVEVKKPEISPEGKDAVKETELPTGKGGRR